MLRNLYLYCQTKAQHNSCNWERWLGVLPILWSQVLHFYPGFPFHSKWTGAGRWYYLSVWRFKVNNYILEELLEGICGCPFTQQHSHPLRAITVLHAVGSPWWFPLGKLARSSLLEITLSIVEECVWTVNKSMCTWCWQHTTWLKRTFPLHVKLLFTYTLMLLARFPGYKKAYTCNMMLRNFPFEWLF